MKPKTFVKARCVEVECPYWGVVKIPFETLDYYYWNDCYDMGMEITFKCPACGESHEIFPI